jgi:hypothetical protein
VPPFVRRQATEDLHATLGPLKPTLREGRPLQQRCQLRRHPTLQLSKLFTFLRCRWVPEAALDLARTADRKLAARFGDG